MAAMGERPQNNSEVDHATTMAACPAVRARDVEDISGLFEEDNVMSTAAEFLQWLRPDGPWLLIAIVPNGSPTAATANTSKDVDSFVKKHDGKRNIYYSVNPTRKAMNKKAEKTDIARIEFLLSDLDPADDEKPENAKARYLGQLSSDFEPKASAIVDSGNGIQTLWKLTEPIVLPDDEKERAAIITDVEARSAALMVRLGGKPGTQNIDRILRLPGTTNLPNKKKREAGRVARPAKLLSVTSTSYPLDAFPEAYGPGSPDDGGHHAQQQEYEERRVPIDIDALPVSDRIKNLIRGIHDPEYPYPSRSEAVMAVLVAMAGAGCTDEQMSGVMLDRTLPIGEHVRDQSKMFGYLIRQIKQARIKAGNVAGEIKIKARIDDVLKSAADLQRKTFEPLRWIVPKYLPEGTSILGGRPKIGKSWSALDIAVGVAEGGRCLGEQCEQGNVLALMLEDSDRRLQRRLTRMLGAQKDVWPACLTYATGWPFLNAEGLDWMRKWIDKAAKPRLIIIDILERVRQRVASKDQKSQYSADYDALTALQELAAEAQLSILVLHHQRKLGAEDLIDTLSGTLGLGGAVDTVLILGKDQTYEKFLYGRGRDLEEFNISVKQNDQGRWQVLGPRVEEASSPERNQILAVLARAGRPMSVQEIAEAINGKSANVKNLLAKLHADGLVERVSTGLYRLPKPQEEMPF
jgi:hypothetical protein